MGLNPKEIFFGEKARKKLVEGVGFFAKSIGPALGPNKKEGQMGPFWSALEGTGDASFGIGGEGGPPDIDLGQIFGKKVVHQMRKDLGDGATTGVILLNALIQEGTYLMESGVSPIEVKEGIDKGVEGALRALDGLSSSIRGIEAARMLEDFEVGKVIEEALSSVPHSGGILIEEGRGMETFLKKIEGTHLGGGYLSQYFCTDKEQMRVQMGDSFILLIDQTIAFIQEIVPILRSLAQMGKGALIIAGNIEPDVLATLVMNHLQGSLNVAAIQAPGFGKERRELLEDLACLTGGEVVSRVSDLCLERGGIRVLGAAEKVEISKGRTLISGKRGNEKRIEGRIREICQQIEETSSEQERRTLEERRDKLMGGATLICVGGHTPIERREKKERFERSLKLVRAVEREGVVPGGGVALLRAAQELETLLCKESEKRGVAAVQRACRAPFKQLVANAGKDAAFYLEKVLKERKEMGFHVLTKRVEDLVQAGVIDPTRVVKQALKVAATVAGEVLLSEVVVVEPPFQKGTRDK